MPNRSIAARVFGATLASRGSQHQLIGSGRNYLPGRKDVPFEAGSAVRDAR